MVERSLMTLNRHIAESQRWHPEATGTFTRMLWDLSLAARQVSHKVNRAGIADIIGASGDLNTTGDVQQKLDVYAEGRFRALGEGGYLCALASEEAETIIPVPEGYPKGAYVFVFDPLDGSTNIDVNASLGTIFGIYRRRTLTEGQGDESDALQCGDALVGAGYIVYGSSTMLVYSTGRGVHGFTLDPSLGEFILSHRNIRIPERGTLYSVNEGNRCFWDERTRRYVDWLKEPAPHGGKPYSLRYIGTMAADFHRTLLTGGVFLYPEDAKNPAKPKHKIRLVYEANPLAWLAEQAGGAASTGEERILSLKPKSLHQKVAIAVGSKHEVAMYERFRRGEAPPA